MPDIEILPAPVRELPVPPEDKWERERLAFVRMRSQLLVTHRDQYVAIREGQVADSDRDKIALALRVYKKFGYMPIYVGLVTEKQLSPARIPSPRVLLGEKRG